MMWILFKWMREVRLRRESETRQAEAQLKWQAGEKERLRDVEEQPTISLRLLSAEDVVESIDLEPQTDALPELVREFVGVTDPPAPKQKRSGRPPGGTLYEDFTVFFDRLARGWDRAKTRDHPQPSCKSVAYALHQMALERIPGIRYMSPDTIGRGLKHHMGEGTSWAVYQALRVSGHRQPPQ